LRILITGAGGLVGRALNDHCVRLDDEVLAYDRNGLDIANATQVEQIVAEVKPEVIINCAAWTDVDGCESDVERSKAVNELGPENLALSSRKTGSLLITISTDYVFDGTKDGFYTQRDNPNPLSIYAQSKLDGERRAQSAHARSVVVRTGFVFGRGGKNFLSTVVDRTRRGEKVKAIADAWGTPTYANHLAARLRELAEIDLPGLFHVVNSGDGTNYADFALSALNLAGCDASNLEVVLMEAVNRPAPRPKNSRLRCLLSNALGLQPLPHWQEGLGQFVQEITQKHTQTGNFHH
jgi:dTDP-4-dehydrorhamnose reductase